MIFFMMYGIPNRQLTQIKHYNFITHMVSIHAIEIITKPKLFLLFKFFSLKLIQFAVVAHYLALFSFNIQFARHHMYVHQPICYSFVYGRNVDWIHLLLLVAMVVLLLLFSFITVASTSSSFLDFAFYCFKFVVCMCVTDIYIDSIGWFWWCFLPIIDYCFNMYDVPE